MTIGHASMNLHQNFWNELGTHKSSWSDGFRRGGPKNIATNSAKTQLSWWKQPYMPLWDAGAISEIYTGHATDANPDPTPITRRAQSKEGNELAQVDDIIPNMKTIKVRMRTKRLPSESIWPATPAPTVPPINTEHVVAALYHFRDAQVMSLYPPGHRTFVIKVRSCGSSRTAQNSAHSAIDAHWPNEVP